jgi:hypothetical protein
VPVYGPSAFISVINSSFNTTYGSRSRTDLGCANPLSDGPLRARRRFNVDLEKARASRHAPSRTAPPASIEQSSRANAMSSAYAALGVSTRAAALGGFSAKVSARRRPSARAPTIFAIRLHARAARSPADRVRPPPHLPAPDSAARAPRPRVPRGHRAGGQGGRRQAQGGEDRPRGGRREGEAP